MKEQNSFAEINFEIKPYNIDVAGHVNNAVYLNWLEDLRVKLFRQFIHLDSLTRNNIHLVVASTSIKYKAPLFLFSKPKGIMKIDKYFKGIWFLSAEIKVENKITTQAFQKCVLMDIKNNRMIKKNIINDEKKLHEVNRY
jgi:acyl-CoA thioester hydrolase